jgi:sec-independent protein translocase protein TatA
MIGFGHLPELVMVLIFALIIFGPTRLPEVGAGLGKSLREFRKAPLVGARRQRRSARPERGSERGVRPRQRITARPVMPDRPRAGCGTLFA